MTRRDLLSERADQDAGQVLAGAKVAALLSGQQPDGGFGVHPYRKWTGAHWRLVSLTELAIPPQEPRAVAAAGHVLAWLASPGRRVRRIGGLARAHASIEGNALATCCRLGLAADPRTQFPRRGSHHLAMARRRVELRPGRHRALFLPRVAGPCLGTARVLAGHRRHRGQRRGQPGRRTVPGPPALPHPGQRPGDPPRLARPALPALLALRHPAGPAHLVPDGQGRATPAAATPSTSWNGGGSRRPMATQRPVVETARQHHRPRSRGLGPVGPNEMITLNALRALQAAARPTPPGTPT